MTATQMFYAHMISIAVATSMVLVGWRSRLAGRLFFVLLFLWASQVNLRMALTNPGVYLDYAPLAMPVYRDFILGFFAAHITAIVATIAAGQLAIALLIAGSGRAVEFGLAGAIFFLIAIAPLGVGAGFPTTLIMAWAAGVLLTSAYPMSLPSDLLHWWRGDAGRRRPGPHSSRRAGRHFA